MNTISSIRAREILDSRGNPTVETDLFLSDGSQGRASVPSGASTGVHEAVELRDGGTRFGGKGVRNAIGNIVRVIAPALIGKTFSQNVLDATLLSLDGTRQKTKLGANALLPISLAFAKASAVSEKVPLWKYFNSLSHGAQPKLPTLMMNILNGGKHALGSTDVQEFMIVPMHKTISESIRIGSEVYHELERILREKKHTTTLTGDEGGFAPTLSSNEEAFQLISEAIQRCGYASGLQVRIGIDVAGSSLFDGTSYVLSADKKKLSPEELLTLYEHWCRHYPLFSIEDPFAEDAWNSFTEITHILGSKLKIVGDDLFVTNIERLRKGIVERAANAIIIKPNQIGTVTETVEVVRAAQKAGFMCIASHRSGETEDTSIAHLAVGLGLGFIKAGAPASGERTSKYNELLRIEEQQTN